MFKKGLASVFFIALVFCMGAVLLSAQTIEHVVWAQSPSSDTIFERTFADVAVKTTWLTPCLLEFQVPACHKFESLFIEGQGGVTVIWSGYTERWSYNWLGMVLVSDLIPDDIQIEAWCGISNNITEINPSGDQGLTIERRDIKYRLTSKSRDFWGATYKGTGQNVPDEVLLPILRNLIDQGFRIQVYVCGEAMGVRKVKVGAIPYFHVTGYRK